MAQTTQSPRAAEQSAKTDMPRELRQQLLKVLSDEFEELHGAIGDHARNESAEVGLGALYGRIHALQQRRAALCLSGGGIRSASFALGVLQALARHGLLGQFHYLSTVSGGGYIGSFLSAWRRNQPNDAQLFLQLSRRGAGYPVYQSDDVYAEPKELQGIRADSNFITPRLGILSGDTLTVIALYLRNLLLNWAVFLPLFLAVILLPHFSYDVLFWAQEASKTIQSWTLVIAVAFLLVALSTAAGGRPARDIGATGVAKRRRFVPSNALWLVVPTFAASAALTIYEAHMLAPKTAFDFAVLWRNAGVSALVYLVAWIVGFLGSSRSQNPGSLWGTSANPVPPLQEMLCWMVSGGAAGFIIALGGKLFSLLWGAAIAAKPPILLALLFADGKHLFFLVAVGVAWVMIAVLIADLIFTGLTSYMKNGDADREWSGRAAGYLAGYALGWLCLASVVLYGPPALEWQYNWVLAAAGGVSGIVTLVLGAGGKTAATIARKASEKLSLNQLLGIATIVFVVFLGIVLSRLTRLLLEELAGAMGIADATRKAVLTLAVLVACCLAALLASYFINVNRFSLHAVYRNRLIRAFLGSARADAGRTPDPFTAFDEKDNVRMSSLWTEGGNDGRRCLFHVVNMALNVVEGDNLAWQERMAESFAVTPLYCGNPIVGFAPTKAYGGPGGGISLGTAMAISGAAASPNQGYHSSPLVGLLMMLFNVRLGWWLGNPRRGQKVYKREGPMLSIRPIIDELLGRTTDEGKYVYLSDGGHFENLGIYEMVRRRCGFILVSDAGCDPDCAFEDLGNALRKIQIDLGVRIEFDRLSIAARTSPPADATYCAIGRICYPEDGAKPGVLIYVKPAYYGTEPADIRSYAAANPTFPHETTADQWFSESQMESYRSLGDYIIDVLCFGDRPPGCTSDCDPLSTSEFIARTAEYLEKTRPPQPSR